MTPDVVIYQEPWAATWDRIKGHLAEIPVFFYSHSIYSGLKEFYSSDAVRNRPNVVVLCNSQATSDFISDTGIRKCVVFPLFGMEGYRGRCSNGHQILMVSIQYIKGVDIALKIASERSNHVFAFVESWSESEEEAAAYRQMMRGMHNVRLLPSQRNLDDIYASTKLLLVPSRWEEGWGRVATEAQLFGIPVLGSNRGNLANTIGLGGVLLDPDAHISLWLNAFDRILGDPQYFSELSQAARQHSEGILKNAYQGVDRIVKLARAVGGAAAAQHH